MLRSWTVFVLAVAAALGVLSTRDAVAKDALSGKAKIGCKTGSIKLSAKPPTSTATYTPFANTHQLVLLGLKAGITTTTLNVIAHFDLEGATFPLTVAPQNITVMSIIQAKIKLTDPTHPAIKSFANDQSSTLSLVITGYDPVAKRIAGTFGGTNLVAGLQNPNDPPRSMTGGKFLLPVQP